MLYNLRFFAFIFLVAMWPAPAHALPLDEAAPLLRELVQPLFAFLSGVGAVLFKYYFNKWVDKQLPPAAPLAEGSTLSPAL